MKKTLLGLTALVAVSCQPAYAQNSVISVDCASTENVQQLVDLFNEEVIMEGVGSVRNTQGEMANVVVSILKSDNTHSIVISSGDQSCVVIAGEELEFIKRGL